MPNDLMSIMLACRVDGCERVPMEVIEAVLDSLEDIPGGCPLPMRRNLVAKALAPRMAEDFWHFCPCYSLLRTEQHARIFNLVDTELANRLASKAQLMIA